MASAAVCAAEMVGGLTVPYPAGTCRDCGDTPEPDRTRCRACAKARREREAVQRNARRRSGLCLTCGAKAAKGKRYCREHLAYYAARDRERRES